MYGKEKNRRHKEAYVVSSIYYLSGHTYVETLRHMYMGSQDTPLMVLLRGEEFLRVILLKKKNLLTGNYLNYWAVILFYFLKIACFSQPPFFS